MTRILKIRYVGTYLIVYGIRNGANPNKIDPVVFQSIALLQVYSNSSVSNPLLTWSHRRHVIYNTEDSKFKNHILEKIYQVLIILIIIILIKWSSVNYLVNKSKYTSRRADSTVDSHKAINSSGLKTNMADTEFEEFRQSLEISSSHTKNSTPFYS